MDRDTPRDESLLLILAKAFPDRNGGQEWLRWNAASARKESNPRLTLVTSRLLALSYRRRLGSDLDEKAAKGESKDDPRG